MSAMEIGKSFGSPQPLCKGNIFCGYTTVNHANGQVSSTSTGEGEWLHYAVEADRYLPAKAGMQLINAIKHPILNKVQKMLS